MAVSPAAASSVTGVRYQIQSGQITDFSSRSCGSADLRVCCFAGSADLIEEIRNENGGAAIRSAIRRHDTAALYDWLMSALSYQGISDRVAYQYMERHGQATWSDLEFNLARPVSCPKLKSYWHFHDCRYDKTSRTCAEPDHIGRCPLPTHHLRNGRLNQTAYSLHLFIHEIADGDLVGWIDRQFQDADDPASPDRLGPTAGSSDRTAPGGLRRLRQGPDHDLVVHPAGRPKATVHALASRSAPA